MLTGLIITYLITTFIYWCEPRTSVANWVMGLVLFIAALPSHGSVFVPSLSTPLSVALGLVVGHVLFGVAILLTRGSLAEATKYFVPVNHLARYYLSRPLYVVYHLVVFDVFEEFLWRVTVQPELVRILNRPWAAIALTALFFTLMHRRRFFYWEQRLEFFLFALLLGLAYYWSNNFALVVTVHLVRDMNILYRKERIEWESPLTEEQPESSQCQWAAKQT